MMIERARKRLLCFWSAFGPRSRCVHAVMWCCMVLWGSETPQKTAVFSTALVVDIEGVTGSIPVVPTMRTPRETWGFSFFRCFCEFRENEFGAPIGLSAPCRLGRWQWVKMVWSCTTRSSRRPSGTFHCPLGGKYGFILEGCFSCVCGETIKPADFGASFLKCGVLAVAWILPKGAQ